MEAKLLHRNKAEIQKEL